MPNTIDLGNHRQDPITENVRISNNLGSRNVKIQVGLGLHIESGVHPTMIGYKKLIEMILIL